VEEEVEVVTFNLQGFSISDENLEALQKEVVECELVESKPNHTMMRLLKLIICQDQ